jgi:hypothetical protein
MAFSCSWVRTKRLQRELLKVKKTKPSLAAALAFWLEFGRLLLVTYVEAGRREVKKHDHPIIIAVTQIPSPFRSG